MLFALFGRHFFEIPVNAIDFLKAFGATLLIGALFIEKLHRKRTHIPRQKAFSTILLPAGMLLLAATLIITHITHLPDFFAGLLHGIAIGLMTWGVVRQLNALKVKG